MGPSKADADSFKNFQHTHHTSVVNFLGGIDYRGFFFSFCFRKENVQKLWIVFILKKIP